MAPASTANINPQAIQLAPMRVSASGVDLGGTDGGVTLMVKTDLADIHVDQYGKTVINSKVLGQVFGMKFVLAETLDQAKWKVAFPHAKLVKSGMNSMVYFDMQTGDDLLSHAVQWTFHPLDKDDNDLTDDITIFQGTAKSASEVKWGPDKQNGLQVELQVFPDTATNPPKFMVHGDPSIGVVNASAGVPAAGGGNTGNGTITSVLASNKYTVTETITLTCVGIGGSSSTEFSVNGSVSGALGVFNVAHASSSTATFVPNSPSPAGYVSFVATQGSTAWAVGDSFTIAMTAANYA